MCRMRIPRLLRDHGRVRAAGAGAGAQQRKVERLSYARCTLLGRQRESLLFLLVLSRVTASAAPSAPTATTVAGTVLLLLLLLRCRVAVRPTVRV